MFFVLVFFLRHFVPSIFQLDYAGSGKSFKTPTKPSSQSSQPKKKKVHHFICYRSAQQTDDAVTISQTHDISKNNEYI